LNVIKLRQCSILNKRERYGRSYIVSVRNDKNLTQNLTQTSCRNNKGPTI